jgi:transcriptional regulator with XRE-family HTH domain
MLHKNKKKEDWYNMISEVKEELLKEFFAIGGNYKPDESKTVEDKLNDYIKNYGDDIKIIDLLRLSQTAEIERQNGNFEEGCELIAPTLKRLASSTELDKWDIRILSSAITHVYDFKDIQTQFEKKFLAGLEKHYSNKPEYDIIKRAFSFNTSSRLLKARFIEMDNVLEPTKKLLDMFETHINILLDMFKDKKESLVLEAVTLIRKGTFYNDSSLVDNGFKILKDNGEKEIYSMLKRECLSYQTYVDATTSKQKTDATVGGNIRKERLARGMTQEQLADSLNMDPGAISHIELGKRGATINVLLRMAKVFGISLEVLIGVKLDDSESYEDPKTQQLMHLFNRLTQSEKDFIIKTAKGIAGLNSHRKGTPLEIIRPD